MSELLPLLVSWFSTLAAPEADGGPRPPDPTP